MKLVPNALGRSIGHQALIAQKHSPTFLFGLGVVGMVGSTVLACRSTLRLEEVLEETNLHLARTIHDEKYSDMDRRKDTTMIYTRGALKVAKLYSPSIMIGVASIGCLTKSHNMLNERNLALTAAYAAIDRAFGEYRGRVVDKYGLEQDREFRYSMETVEVLDEKGKMETVQRVDIDDIPSMYARFFDSYAGTWSKDPEYNYIFLRCQQQWANDMLKARGHLFLNEVYDSLGLQRTKAGSVVGWRVSRDGDNFVDFGIFEDNQTARDFVNGREGAILLDFNVDGIIYDKIDPDEHTERIRWQS
jgi:Family of unknown function (DUF6353)